MCIAIFRLVSCAAPATGGARDSKQWRGNRMLVRKEHGGIAWSSLICVRAGVTAGHVTRHGRTPCPGRMSRTFDAQRSPVIAQARSTRGSLRPENHGWFSGWIVPHDCVGAPEIDAFSGRLLRPLWVSVFRRDYEVKVSRKRSRNEVSR